MKAGGTIVNASNTGLQMVCGAIFRAAVAEQLQSVCNMLPPIQTGGVAITPGLKLPAKYVIHTVGPVYSIQNKEESPTFLRSAYI